MGDEQPVRVGEADSRNRAYAPTSPIHFKAVLNTGEIVEEGIAPWVEIPGESLPWRRLCEHLAKEGKWIDTLFIATPKGLINVTEIGDFKTPDFYSIQNDLVVDNIMGGGNVTNTLHVASHFDNAVIHTFFNEEGLVDVNVSTEEYKPLVPSPKNP